MTYTMKPSDIYTSWSDVCEHLKNYEKSTGIRCVIVDFRPPKGGDTWIDTSGVCSVFWYMYDYKLPRFIIRPQNIQGSVWE